jgi:hypothetical protein
VPVRNVPTRVVYRVGGLSHFDTVRDNVRITRVYASALLGVPWGRARGRKRSETSDQVPR